jgi:hypothetical protein
LTGEFKALRDAERPSPKAPGRRVSRLTAGLIEAAALIEAVATLIAGHIEDAAQGHEPAPPRRSCVPTAS